MMLRSRNPEGSISHNRSWGHWKRIRCRYLKLVSREEAKYTLICSIVSTSITKIRHKLWPNKVHEDIRVSSQWPIWLIAFLWTFNSWAMTKLRMCFMNSGTPLTWRSLQLSISITVVPAGPLIWLRSRPTWQSCSSKTTGSWGNSPQSSRPLKPLKMIRMTTPLINWTCSSSSPSLNRSTERSLTS